MASSSNGAFTDILLQTVFDDPQEIAKKETGLKISQRIYTEQTQGSDNLNFFSARSLKWINILKWATGTQDMTEFLSFFNVSDANKAYVKIDMSPIMIGPQFVLTLVESMSKNEEYPCVTAIDDDSIQEKENRKQDALYKMHEVDTIDEVQQKTGMQVEPKNAYVPDDELSAKVYFELEDRLPKEIKLETKLDNCLTENKYARVLKPKSLYDLITLNFGSTKIDRKPNGKYCIVKPIPQNVFYNYFVGDTGKYEIGYIGHVYSLKAKDLRSLYGITPQNPNGLTEKEIYDLAKMSSTKNTGLGFNFLWKIEYQYYNYKCPWDEHSIYCIDYEINLGTSDYYVSKPDNYGNSNIAQKQSIPKPQSEKAKILKKDKSRWYRGVYAPYARKMIYWGLPDIIILPYMETEQSLSSWSINIPFNNGQYVPSLFERAMEPLKEYALTKLKRKQLISKLRPSGIRIDVHSARNLDLGNGNTIAWEEVVRVFDQTGNELWSSRGLDPLRQEAPALSATAPDDTLQKIIQLTQTLEGIILELRQLLGVPQYRDGSDVGDRTSGKLAEAQGESSFNVTDYITRAHNELWEETLYKILLLEWQDAIKAGDSELINSRFRVDVQMKLSLLEKQQLEQNIQIGMQEQLLTFKDAFMIRQIKNYKLANWYLNAMEEKNKKEAAQMQQQNVQDNAQAQQQSAQQAAQAAAQQQQDKLAAEKDIEEFKAQKQMELATVTGLWQAIGKGIISANTAAPILQQLIPNITLSLALEQEQIKHQIADAAAQSQQQMQQAAMQQQQSQQEPQMQQ